MYQLVWACYIQSKSKSIERYILIIILYKKKIIVTLWNNRRNVSIVSGQRVEFVLHFDNGKKSFVVHKEDATFSPLTNDKVIAGITYFSIKRTYIDLADNNLNNYNYFYLTDQSRVQIKKGFILTYLLRQNNITYNRCGQQHQIYLLLIHHVHYILYSMSFIFIICTCSVPLYSVTTLIYVLLTTSMIFPKVYYWIQF